MRKSVLFVVLASFVAVYANDKAHNHTAAPAHTMQHHQEMLDTQTPLTPSQQMLNLMHEPMMKTPFLEDDNLDLNFISNMIPHHQGAVDSSEFLLKHSKNKQLRAIATQIIKTQQAEINEFEALIPQLKQQKKLYSPKEVTLFNQQAKQDMETMHKDMSNITLTKNINHDFLADIPVAVPSIVLYEGSISIPDTPFTPSTVVPPAQAEEFPLSVNFLVCPSLVIPGNLIGSTVGQKSSLYCCKSFVYNCVIPCPVYQALVLSPFISSWLAILDELILTVKL